MPIASLDFSKRSARKPRKGQRSSPSQHFSCFTRPAFASCQSNYSGWITLGICKQVWQDSICLGRVCSRQCLVYCCWQVLSLFAVTGRFSRHLLRVWQCSYTPLISFTELC